MTDEKPRYKTVQALKVLASWSPSASVSEEMLAAAFPAVIPAAGIRYSSGRIVLRAYFPARFGDADFAVRVNAAIKAMEDRLRAAGSLWSFSVTAGAVDPAELIEID